MVISFINQKTTPGTVEYNAATGDLQYYQNFKREYIKRLVPLGFPLLVWLKPLARSAAKIAPDIASKVSNIKSLEKNLQQHITFLQDETFFQKAHKTAKKSGIIGRSEMARAWYHDHALEQGLDFRSLEMIREGGKE